MTDDAGGTLSGSAVNWFRTRHENLISSVEEELDSSEKGDYGYQPTRTAVQEVKQMRGALARTNRLLEEVRANLQGGCLPDEEVELLVIQYDLEAYIERVEEHLAEAESAKAREVAKAKQEQESKSAAERAKRERTERRRAETAQFLNEPGWRNKERKCSKGKAEVSPERTVSAEPVVAGREQATHCEEEIAHHATPVVEGAIDPGPPPGPAEPTEATGIADEERTPTVAERRAGEGGERASDKVGAEEEGGNDPDDGSHGDGEGKAPTGQRQVGRLRRNRVVPSPALGPFGTAEARVGDGEGEGQTSENADGGMDTKEPAEARDADSGDAVQGVVHEWSPGEKVTCRITGGEQGSTLQGGRG